MDQAEQSSQPARQGQATAPNISLTLPAAVRSRCPFQRLSPACAQPSHSPRPGLAPAALASSSFSFSCCSQYWPIGNTVFNGGYSWYAQNVTRSTCQAATGDDWCAACSGKVCTSCYPRPQYGQAMQKHKITRDPTTKRVRAGTV